LNYEQWVTPASTESSILPDKSASYSSVSIYDSVFNAAVAYRQAGRHDLAEEFYRKATKLRPKVRILRMFVSENLYSIK